MDNKETHAKGCGKWRIPFGLLAFYILWLISAILVLSANGFLTFFAILFFVFIYLFLFGVLGDWLLTLDIYGAINPILLIFGKIFGYIGFILRPYPILIYGANKKWGLNVFLIVPILLICLLCIFALIGIIPDLNFGNEGAIKIIIISLIFVLFTFFGVKKCPDCKCVMSDIDFESIEFGKTKYYQKENENIGYLKDSNGDKVDVYCNVEYERDGMQNKFAKIYTCKKCGAVKYGIKFNAVTKI